MTEQGLLNTTAEYGYPIDIITEAVPFAGMPVYQTATAGTFALATNAVKPLGFTIVTSVPNPELCLGTTAVAGQPNSIMPIRDGVIVKMPVTATGVITCGKPISIGAVAGYVTQRTTENYIIGIAMESVNNAAGASGDKFVKVCCAPYYIYTA